MSAILQAAFCAAIFFMIGLRYRPFPDTRYKLCMSLIAWAACSITGMQFVNLVGRIILRGEVPDGSWFNTAFYFLAALLVFRAKGNVARILRVD
ncbi:phage holin family protein [Pseudomonas sp. N3-W]|uniref:phage holin family protein n=1 Tax=Pseudomonas sp. N3-W TaxID=2975049 RepID=UPI00217D8D12|nr:phage holin family protein [Pseudomonas sp. N3-W]UWF46889.1 phage holin family protein [Pseudomonas sp. N3-W]